MLAIWSRRYDRLLSALFGIGCLLLFAMAVMICADVVTRNLEIGSMSWSNEVSEMMLSWMTLLAAPWILRQGQHIRVDILLQALPDKVGWYCEWIADVLGFVCCIVLTYYGWVMTHESYVAKSMITKTMETPEWWTTTPWTICFVLMALEFVFRMDRLRTGPRRPRHDAVSAS